MRSARPNFPGCRRAPGPKTRALESSVKHDAPLGETAGSPVGRERLQFRGRCTLAREVPQRHQRLSTHARVTVVEQLKVEAKPDQTTFQGSCNRFADPAEISGRQRPAEHPNKRSPQYM